MQLLGRSCATASDALERPWGPPGRTTEAGVKRAEAENGSPFVSTPGIARTGGRLASVTALAV